MPLETPVFISDLVTANPPSTDPKSEGAAHLRNIKSALKATFPNVTGAVTATQVELNQLAGSTSAIQTQLNTKAPSISPVFTVAATLPAATTIGTVTAAEVLRLSGVTGPIQTQLNTKAPIASPVFTGVVNLPPTGFGLTEAVTKSYADALSMAAALPAQTGNAGKIITTNGVTASWQTNRADLPITIVTTTTQTAVDGNHYVMSNAALSTLTLPASPANGAGIDVTFANGRVDNVIARNGSGLMVTDAGAPLLEDMVYDVPSVTLSLVFAGNAWRFEAQGSSIAITETIETTALNLRNATETAALLVRNATEAAAVLSRGYEAPIAYTAGISLTRTTQTVSQLGVVYAPVMASLPFTTSGTFETAKFRVVQGGGRDIVSVRDFGAVGDGVTPDQAAFVAACLSLGVKGGTVRYYDKHLIDASFTVPSNVTLKGPMTCVGSPGDNVSAPYGNMAALILNSAATITLLGGAGHDGGLVYRKGMVFPSADAAGFAGTAFTGGGDDTFLTNSQVIGFSKAYFSTGKQRPRICNNWLDNINGIEIAVCYDIAYVSDNHAWPFATIAFDASGQSPRFHRTGTAFLFRDGGDWNRSTNNFSYGYQRGHQVINCNSMTLIGASHDNTTINATAIGIEISGTSNETRLIGCQAAAQSTGIFINTAAGTHTYVEGCQTWVNSARGMLINGGNVTVNGGGHRNAPEGITVNNAASTVTIDNVNFVSNPIPVNALIESAKIRIGKNNSYTGQTAGSRVAAGLLLNSIASAATVDALADHSVFNVTGTVNIGTITSGHTGREISLLFTSALTMLHTIAANGIRLQGGVNFAVVNGSTLTVMHNGTQWYETGRAA